jgi:hypothetical protein
VLTGAKYLLELIFLGTPGTLRKNCGELIILDYH